MKKIFNILLAAAAMLFFAPFVNAQEDYSINGQIKDQKTGATLSFPKLKPVEIDEENKIAYSKNVSSPFSDGTYWIKLETFATGTASESVSSSPADIILVLDSSSSMDYNYGEHTAYYSRGVQSYTWQGILNTEYYYYMEADDEYYLVSRGPNNNPRCLTFTDKNGKPWYLNNWVANNSFSGEGLLEEPPSGTGTGPNNQSSACWRGELYELRAQTRLDALKDATKQFIDNIWQNDHDVTAVDASFAGNRIAIITYDNQTYKLTSSYNWGSGNANRANWFDIGATGVKDNLKNAIDRIATHNWTRPGLGMRDAIGDLLDGDPASKRDGAKLTVVMFTDGVPARQTGTGNTFENDVANQGIYYGYQLKHDYGANLFTVGLLNINSTDENVIKGIHFLDLLSSNYPNSFIDAGTTNNSAWTINGNIVSVQNLTGGEENDKDPEGDYFQLDDGDLTSIFDAISKQSGGTANPSLSAATSTVDIVSNSFILPDGINAENVKDYIKVFTAKLNRIENGKYYFDTEILIPHSPDKYNVYNSAGELESQVDVDDAIVVSLEGTNGIKVTNFDYSKNFCGPVYKDDGTTFDHWQGHEVIIMIPIKMNPEAVGGPNVETNVEGSGIYIDPESDPIISFESPTVSLPVNVHLTKTGLSLGESAKFKIERAVLLETEVDQDENGVPDRLEANTAASEALWQYVSTVFVTKTSTDDPLVKVKGMPATTEGEGEDQAGFIYRITEEEWSWSYSRDTEPQYTKTSKVDNPFTFNNTKKPNIDYIIRNAESKVTNVFKTGDFNPKYNDSKNNGRTQYNPTSTQSGSGTGSSGNQ